MDPATRSDVIVVGGGPAGSLAALDLARGGCRVVLLDGSHPRHKPCSGFLAEDLSTLHPAIAAFDRHAPFDGDRVYVTPHGRRLRVPGSVAPTRFRLSSRRELDLFLVEQAVAAGVTWVREHARGVARTDGGWEIRAAASSHRAPIVVGADGARSVVRRAVLGPIDRRDLLLSVGRRFAGRRADELRVVFRDDGDAGFLLPGFEGAQAVVAARVPRAEGMGARLRSFLARWAPDWDGQASSWAGLQPSPLRVEALRAPCAGDSYCLIGDAAGHGDALNLEGLRYAVQGAIEAAAAILAGRPREYEARWRDRFGARLERASFVVRHAPGVWALEAIAAGVSRSSALLDALAEARSLSRAPRISPSSIAALLARMPRIAAEVLVPRGRADRDVAE
jgi:flavin-dependent dehydrogenase